jgi:hypothetical protein
MPLALAELQSKNIPDENRVSTSRSGRFLAPPNLRPSCPLCCCDLAPTYYEMQSSYSAKQVIRAGEVVQQIHDREQKAQGLDWVLLDIFAPYKTEYYAELEFGSLWQQWLNDVRSVTEDLAARV